MKAIASDFPPPVKGLVIAGGFSRRMGQDKALIDYHGLPQVVWTHCLLREVCEEVWISCRPEQDLGPANHLPRIHDREPGRGPVEGIAAAMVQDPQSAWLVVACDLPRLNAETLRHLLDHRADDLLATAYQSANDDLPEPLCAVYEPAIQPVLEASIRRQRGCPRKILIEAGWRVRLLPPRADHALDNCNTPEEAAEIRRSSVIFDA